MRQPAISFGDYGLMTTARGATVDRMPASKDDR
jgi:hypothetical protein